MSSDGVGLSGSLGYFRSSHDGTRNGAGGIEYKADYGSNTFVARGDVSKIYSQDGFSITPQASLTYTRTSYDGYTETSTGGAPKTIGAFSATSLVGALGVSVSSDQMINGVQVTPELHARGLYEFNDVLGSYSGSLAGITGSNFSADVTSADRLKWNLGGSVQVNHTDQLTSEFMYDGISSSDSAEHLLKYKGSYQF